MSRDDGMDEHGIGLIFVFYLAGFWHRRWANHCRFFHTLTTNLTQELIGSMDVFWQDFG
jgi:hypothetical protein